jgi:uncharacterized membrane protein YoaK (UPF0700 family)
MTQEGGAEPSALGTVGGQVDGMTAEWYMRSHRSVPVLLGFAAGYVDGCTFVALFGLFVAQVTGSFVVAGALLVVRERGTLVRVLAIPVFLLGSVIATVVVSIARHKGWRATPILLGLESLLLAGLLATVMVASDINNPDQPAALAAGLFGLCAMGVQSAFVRLLMRGTPSTNVMTTNTTQLAIDGTEVLLARFGTGRSEGFPTPAYIGRARKRLADSVPIMLAFLVGTIAGAVICHGVGLVCLALPVAGCGAHRADHSDVASRGGAVVTLTMARCYHHQQRRRRPHAFWRPPRLESSSTDHSANLYCSFDRSVARMN